MTPTPDQLALWAKLAAVTMIPAPAEGFVLRGVSAEFYTAALEAVPMLLAEVERLRGEVLEYGVPKRLLCQVSRRGDELQARVAALEGALRKVRDRIRPIYVRLTGETRPDPAGVAHDVVTWIDTALSPGLPGKEEEE